MCKEEETVESVGIDKSDVEKALTYYSNVVTQLKKEVGRTLFILDLAKDIQDPHKVFYCLGGVAENVNMLDEHLMFLMNKMKSDLELLQATNPPVIEEQSK